MGMARREPVPTPWLTGRPSWNCLAGSWQLAHDTAPLRLRRVSLNRRRPRSMAAGRCSTALDGSAGTGGSCFRLRDASTALSSALQRTAPAAGCCSPASASVTVSAAHRAAAALVSIQTIESALRIVVSLGG
jgi:hypothetical protein